MSVKLPRGYEPSEKEKYMCPRQLEFFRRELLRRRAELIEESSHTLQNLQEETTPAPDLADRAATETDRALELRTRDRERKLIAKIDAALRRIEDGSYGYCEETGELIGIRRLIARPIATLSIEAQERHERIERSHRDD
ncbi:MAG: RNA polymerase-binding protein DksA [Alphaproteobacteria bacterium]|nr:RNA polymerase-binding protein DksA [Alphaproteobacteria bacterium]